MSDDRLPKRIMKGQMMDIKMRGIFAGRAMFKKTRKIFLGHETERQLRENGIVAEVAVASPSVSVHMNIQYITINYINTQLLAYMTSYNQLYMHSCRLTLERLYHFQNDLML